MPRTEQEKNKRSFFKAFGEAVNRRGQASEILVKEVIETAIAAGEVPGWIKGYRVVDAAEQARSHCDGWIETDVGPIALEIKSSLKGVQEGRKDVGKKAEDIAYVLVKPGSSQDDVLKACISAVAPLRARYLAQRNQGG
jgi:hypothetical protein